MKDNKIRFGVIVFPGSNCDADTVYAIRSLGFSAEYIWYEETKINSFQVVVLPGGFSYGDYLRAGSIASFSTQVMDAVRKFSEKGGLVLGICNGFQILTEFGLLDGALIKNESAKFISKFVKLEVENNDTPFTCILNKGDNLVMPIAHGYGNFYYDNPERLEKEKLIVLRYVENPNGSIHNISAITNSKKNISLHKKMV